MLKKVNILERKRNVYPKFVKTELLICEREGKEFFWETVSSHNSVHILVYNPDTKNIIVVKQVRVPVLSNDPTRNGEVIEACAGLIDKDTTIEQIAVEEVDEELGYSIRQDALVKVKVLKSGVGTAGGEAHTFIAKVTKEDKVSLGGGLESEDIEVVYIPYNEIENFFYGPDSEDTDATTLFLVNHFMRIMDI